MSLVHDLLARTTAALASSPGVRTRRVPPQWAERWGQVGEHPAVIRGWAWSTPTCAWARVAVLEAADRVGVFSALILPRPRFDLPIFGAEVVIINGAVTVVAFDWVPLFPNSPYITPLAAIRRPFAHFPPGGELPPWAADAFSPYALFSRPRGTVPDTEIGEAFSAYLVGYLGLHATAPPRGATARTRAAQQDYCTAHQANDPGGSMLAKAFGRAWAEAYARAFLFRLPASRSDRHFLNTQSL